MQQPKLMHIVRVLADARTDAESRAAVIWSENTQAVAVAAASGVPVRDYSRTVEPGPEFSKTVASFALAEEAVEFRPEFEAEKVTVGEIVRRCADTAWIEANPHHPIAFMVAALEANKRLVKAIKTKAPLIAYRVGRKCAYLTPVSAEEDTRRLLEKAGFPAAQIESIVSSLRSIAQGGAK